MKLLEYKPLPIHRSLKEHCIYDSGEVSVYHMYKKQTGFKSICKFYMMDECVHGSDEYNLSKIEDINELVFIRIRKKTYCFYDNWTVRKPPVKPEDRMGLNNDESKHKDKVNNNLLDDVYIRKIKKFKSVTLLCKDQIRVKRVSSENFHFDDNIPEWINFIDLSNEPNTVKNHISILNHLGYPESRMKRYNKVLPHNNLHEES